MQTPILIIIVFIACPIAALLFIVRLVAAPFSSKVANQMRKHPFIHIMWAGFAFVGVLAVIGEIYPSSLTGGTRGRYMRAQEHYAEAFKAGDTNVPLLEMDWFAPTVHFCRVSQSGKGSARRDVGHAIQAGVSISLDETNLQALVETINHLPAPPKKSLPVERQIVVGCIRSNQWFHAVYDRANIPNELEIISEITGAYLPWFIPEVSGYSVAVAKQGKFSCMALNAPIVISQHDEVDGIHPIHPVLHIWDISQNTYKPISESSLFSEWASQWESVATSPDGNIIGVVSYNGLYVVDWKSKVLKWSDTHIDRAGGWILNKRILVAGDKSQYLFAIKSDEHLIHRLNLLTGEELGVLGNDIPAGEGDVGILKVSNNGKILVAGFGSYRPKTFAVWEVGKDEPVAKFTEPDGAYADVSPDGELIALCRFGSENLVLYRWRSGERKEVHLRNSQSVNAVYWSPDGKRLAAYVDTYPASIIIYDATSWKPIAHWNCGRIGESSEFYFGCDGLLYQIRKNELNALDVPKLNSIVHD
ncbi:MAG TPA: hypothetical protein VHY30_08980 [Verrucomicrobiae bacterium]|jgi:hypothetical protein|nr:hypothetical protein [Verrucomicrobiae bacterium]